jgi:hypothetical protein
MHAHPLNGGARPLSVRSNRSPSLRRARCLRTSCWRTFCWACLALAGWASSGVDRISAQQLSDVYLVETTQDQLVRLTDLDGDGHYHSKNEVRALFYDGENGSNFSSPRSVAVRVESGKPVLYWIDTQRDQLFNGHDDNGNGTIDLGEEGRYRFILAYDGATSPDGLAPTADTAVWWCSDAGVARGLFRCIDLNGNGDANDPNESDKLIDGASPHVCASDAGPVSIDSGDFLRMASAGNVVVVYGQGDDEAAYRFEKLNADADLLDAGESRLFLNASGKNAAFPQNADWQSGLLRSLVLPAPGGKGTTHAKLAYWTSRQEAGATAWYCATSASAAFNPLNLLGQAVNGLVFRGVDLNLDGDLQDAGEVRLYYDGSLTSGAPFQIDQINGLDAGTDGIYLGALAAGDQVVHRLRDVNGDGDALDAGEQQMSLFDYSQWTFAQPFFIGNPFVWDIGVGAPGLFENWFIDSGSACAPTAAKPALGFSGDTHVGSPTGFEIRVTNVPAGLPAILYVGSSSTSWLGLPLPFDLSVVGFPGCTLYQNLVASFPAFTTGSGPIGGSAKKQALLASDPMLYGVDLPCQWALLEPSSGALLLTKLGTIHLLAP